MTSLYLISPPTLPDGFALLLEQALKPGLVSAFQLRIKDVSDDIIIKTANELIPICKQYNVNFILNDRPDLVVKLQADGVHIGIDDISVKEAREIIGPEKALGVSCYDSKDRAIQAGDAGADYISFGAFYPTTTKEPLGHPTPEILTWWSENTVLPSVAIGGINPNNAPSLIEAGADFIAIISYVWTHKSGPETAILEFSSLIK